LLTPAYVAVIVTGVDDETLVEVMLKVAEVAPPGTGTDGVGLAAVGLELVSCTDTPPAGAGPSRYTRLVVVVAPPVKDVDASAIELSIGGRTVRMADAEAPP